jgi:HEAT repeat protein
MGYDLSKEQHRLNDVRLILKDLLKVVKVVAMYPEGNPLPQSMRRTFAEKLAAIVTTYGSIKISIGRETISLGDETVYTDASKEESLAAMLFDPGVTSITFKEDLDIAEVYRLLDVLKEYNNSNRRSDLVAQIWEANLTGIALTTVEDVALSGYDGDFRIAEIFDSGDTQSGREIQLGTDQNERYNSIFCALDNATPERADLSESHKAVPGDSQPVRRTDAFFFATTADPNAESVLSESERSEPSLHTAEAAQAMGFGDILSAPPAPGLPATPNTALILNSEFKLTELEEREIAEILADDARFDPYEASVELLKEMLLQDAELPEFSETVQTCEKVIGEFIHNGRLAEAGQLLVYFRQLEERLKTDRPMWAERLKNAALTAGGRNRLKLLHEALNQNESVSAVELRRYLELLGWESLEGLVDMLGELQHEVHRRALCDHLVVHGKDHLPLIGKGVFDKKWFVVRNAVMILAQMDDDRAVSYLEKAMGNQDRRVRLEVLAALRHAANPKSVQLLKRAALDSDPEVCTRALDSLLAQPKATAFEVVSELVADNRFDTVEPANQQRLLNAYSSLGGKVAVPYLKSLIEQRNLWHDQALSFLRDAAFEALSHNRSEQAEALLVAYGNSWMPKLKHQAQAALKHRRENIFGGDHDRI